ncbi:hypothetical protein GCM10010168_33730 [Actinoplanes ianthinogenes]|nr:hypothetical protein GCM10010168_33730 [Actinoplanes ianthinogenes]
MCARRALLVQAACPLHVTEKVGRARLCRLAAAPLDEAMAWIAFYQRLWARRLDGLDVFFTLRSGTPPHEPGQRAANPSDDGKGPQE